MTFLATLPDSFFTTATLFTLLGSTTAVYLICNVAQQVFNFSPKWLALLVSIIISFIGAAVTSHTPEGSTESVSSGQNYLLKYFIALLNGLLIWATATGTNQITS